jgi:hypothetical protein
MVVRQYNEELKYLEKLNPYCWRIKKGFQPNMNVSLTSVMSSSRLVNYVRFYSSLPAHHVHLQMSNLWEQCSICVVINDCS